jgi:hypothetical protein
MTWSKISPRESRFRRGAQIGARYFLNDHIGFFGEWGGTPTAYSNLGMTHLRFSPSGHKTRRHRCRSVRSYESRSVESYESRGVGSSDPTHPAVVSDHTRAAVLSPPRAEVLSLLSDTPTPIRMLNPPPSTA